MDAEKILAAGAKDIGDGVLYLSDFLIDPDAVFRELWNNLDWERRGATPRREYYTNLVDVPYMYGRGRGIRKYMPKPIHPEIAGIRRELSKLTGDHYEVCFLNGYQDQRDHLGWHADDSPEMDDLRSIAIISLGVEREIWFRPQDDKEAVTKVKLAHGSLCLMPPKFQCSHYHRIPKASFECGERISLTYRGYVEP